MASSLCKILPSQTTLHVPHTIPCFETHLPLFLEKLPRRFIVCSLSSAQDLSSTTYRPPSTREEAVSQAKTCLSTTLQKPLNNPIPLPTRKLKKQRQPRYRVEIPVVDDSANSLTQLAFEVFSNTPFSRKGLTPTILILWPSSELLEAAKKAFGSTESANLVINSELGPIRSEVLGSSALAVFVAPATSRLEEIRMVTNSLYPKPVVLFNPRWGFEEEKDFGGGMASFVGSFDVVYSFMGLEVRGVLSKRKGVVLKCVRDGVLSGEGWVVMVEEEGKKGELKVVSRFKRRPSIGEVESVLYNLMAANSPVTKSLKFLRDLASNAMGNKAKE